MDGQLFTYTTELDKSKHRFSLPNGTLTNYINIEHKINLRNLHLRHIQFIIGLNLLFTTFQGCILSASFFDFLSLPALSFTSEFAQKRGGSLLSSPSSPCCTKCSDYFNEEAFQQSSLYLELVEIPHSQYMIAPIYLYDLLSFGNLEIGDILSKLAKEEIIGEDPGKHWEKSKLLCKLELKGPELRIQNKKIESTNENIKEFELHINELLKL